MDEQAAITSTSTPENDATRNPIRRRLGRGLNALLGGAHEGEATGPAADPQSNDQQPSSTTEPAANEVAVELIERNPFQPRKEFAKEPLNELAESLKTHGVLQPLLVRPHNGRYQLIAGERRWLAAQQAGLETVPCRVLELEDQAVCEVAIVENVQRKDLSDLEKAQAFQDYLDQFGGTVADLARQLGMNRTTVTNFIRLLSLSAVARQALSSGKISGGHGRALLSLEESQQAELIQRIQAEGLSVRKTEEAVKQLQHAVESAETDDGEGPVTIPLPSATVENNSATADSQTQTPAKSNHVVSIENNLREVLGLKVEIKLTQEHAGKVMIQFDSQDDFEKVVRALRQGGDSVGSHAA